jgi:hypothetical protein
MPARLAARLPLALLLLALPTLRAAEQRPPATSPTPAAALAELRRLDAGVTTNADRQVIGISFGCGTPARDRDIGLVRAFPDLERLTVVCEQDVSDAGIEQLKGLKLKRLFVVSEKLTDKSFEHLATLTELEHLTVRESKVSAAALGTLGKLPKLKALRLSDSGLTDADLKHFAGFPALTELKIGSHAVTDAGLKAARDALPKATVTR